MGIFTEAQHEGAAGTLDRADLTAAFRASREAGQWQEFESCPCRLPSSHRRSDHGPPTLVGAQESQASFDQAPYMIEVIIDCAAVSAGEKEGRAADAEEKRLSTVRAFKAMRQIASRGPDQRTAETCMSFARGRDDDNRLIGGMIKLARQYRRYGDRRIATLLRDAGWRVNDRRVERLWRREGLKVLAEQPKRSRRWLNDDSCIRLRAERANHVWSHNFEHHCTHDKRAFRILSVLEDVTHESLAIRVRRKFSSTDVVDVLTDLFILRGIPTWIRSDNGAGVRRRGHATMGRRGWDPHRFHRARLALGEQLHREFHCAAARRTPGRRTSSTPGRKPRYSSNNAGAITTRSAHMEACEYRPSAPETIAMPSQPPGSTPLLRPTRSAQDRNALTFEVDHSLRAIHLHPAPHTPSASNN